MSEVAWTPSSEQVERANLTRLARRLGCDDYPALLRVSVEEPERFWPAVVDDLGIRFSTPWEHVLDVSDGPEWARWFTGGRVNIARACVHDWAARDPDGEALVWLAEDGERRALGFAALSHEVTRVAEGLAALGVGEGDAVALLLPMSLEVVVASHACAHLGAIQVPIFSGFAAAAVAARLQDSRAKVLVTADGTLRRGKTVVLKEVADEAVALSPSVEHVVVWRRLGIDVPFDPPRDVDWAELVDGRPGTLPALELDSEAPYLLAYTSGTTGRPKGAVHVQGGFLVSIAREVAYQADVRAGDRIHFVTDMGWIMGPWTVVGGGACGATIVLAEGAPDWPADRVWRTVETEHATQLGISPTLVRALIPKGDPTADLSSLRAFVTTGEPWNLEPYRWLSQTVGGRRVPIVNESGGTEVGACFLASPPIAPQKACSLGFPALGIDLDVVDADGQPVHGEVGELVCRRPWPGMTRGIWGDPERYLDTYWRRFPGMWTHGDWASLDEDGYWFLHGRSDDTLNVAGKRIGPAELESAAVSHPGVAEAAAIAVPHDLKGEVPWLFCVPVGEPAPGLEREVAKAVIAQLGPAFKPDRVLFVESLPRTRSAKIVRRAVRAGALGTDPGDVSSLENPESVEEIARAVGR